MMRKPIPNRFDGKVAIVTGGSSGIGRAITEELAKEGASVLFSCLESDREEAEEVCQLAPDRLKYRTGDMAEPDFNQELVDSTVENFGRLDYLVNNAFSFVAASTEATLEQWHRSLEVGPIAFGRMGALALPHMENQGGGAIVNVSSISSPYCSAPALDIQCQQGSGETTHPLYGHGFC